MMTPKRGTLERIVLEKLIEKAGEGVTHLDFAGTGVTEANLDQIMGNLQSGMFEAENDADVKKDS